jgi:hypothetical protein
MFGYQSPWINQRPWYMQPVYDWSKCCPDNIDGETAWYQFLSLMKAIFGYQVGDWDLPVHFVRVWLRISLIDWDYTGEWEIHCGNKGHVHTHDAK